MHLRQDLRAERVPVTENLVEDRKIYTQHVASGKLVVCSACKLVPGNIVGHQCSHELNATAAHTNNSVLKVFLVSHELMTQPG